jgi:hypothetical protein
MGKIKNKKERLIVFEDTTASLDKHSLIKGYPPKREVLPRELTPKTLHKNESKYESYFRSYS